VVEVGLLWTLGAFAGGYVAGMKMGDRPIVAAKSRMEEMRGKAMEAGTAGAEAIRGNMPAVDVRHVREVMSSPAETVRPDTTVREAATVMQRKEIGDVLVVDGSGELRGIVTDRDLAVRALAEGRDATTTKVSDLMSPIVATVPPEESVSEALDLMRRHDIRRVPVVEGGKPLGIVTLGDVSRSFGAGRALADISAAPANN
jgi:CBS domain-containing protein